MWLLTFVVVDLLTFVVVDLLTLKLLIFSLVIVYFGTPR